MFAHDPPPAIDLGRLLDEAAPDTAALASAAKVPVQRPEWGGWRLHRGALSYPTSRQGRAFRYRIDLDRIAGPADVLGWVAHIAGKPWGDAAVAGLVRAFVDVLDPALTGQDQSWLR